MAIEIMNRGGWSKRNRQRNALHAGRRGACDLWRGIGACPIPTVRRYLGQMGLGDLRLRRSAGY